MTTLRVPIEHQITSLSPPWASLVSDDPGWPSIDLTNDCVMIGRDDICHLQINHPAISGVHCILYKRKGNHRTNEKSVTSTIVEDIIRRRSRIKVRDVVDMLDTDQQQLAGKKGTLNNRYKDAVSIWLTDVSTNGTFIANSLIGHGKSMVIEDGAVFTLLKNSTLSYTLNMHGAAHSHPAPTGTVTVVFTDIESSTTLWDTCALVMEAALEMHDKVLRNLIRVHHGYEVKTEGDAFMVAFASTIDAVQWCLAVQRALLQAEWDELLVSVPAACVQYVNEDHRVLLYRGLRIRMGVHVGQPSCRRHPITRRMDYFGTTVNLAARVSDAGHGGQILCTREVLDAFPTATAATAHVEEEHSFEVTDCGSALLKGLSRKVHVYQLNSSSLSLRRWEPPLRVACQTRLASHSTDVVLGGTESTPVAPMLELHAAPVVVHNDINNMLDAACAAFEVESRQRPVSTCKRVSV